MASCAPAVAKEPPTWAPSSVLDGPSADIQSLTGLSVARDGTGGLAYLKDVGGVPHVFVSQLLGGVFSSPIEVDSTLVNASSDPVIAAGNDGMLLIAFVNSGNLFVDVSPSGPAAFGGPRLLFADAGSPTVGATYLDKGYVAFTADVGGVEQVRAAYYWHGVWGLEPTALNAAATENAGTGSDAPVIAASQDGVATVAWGNTVWEEQTSGLGDGSADGNGNNTVNLFFNGTGIAQDLVNVSPKLQSWRNWASVANFVPSHVIPPQVKSAGPKWFPGLNRLYRGQ